MTMASNPEEFTHRQVYIEEMHWNPWFWLRLSPKKRGSNLKQSGFFFFLTPFQFARKCLTFPRCSKRIKWFYFNLRLIEGWRKTCTMKKEGIQKHVRSLGRLLRCSALSAPREGLDRHSPEFTFLNPRVRALSEDSTVATSPTEINKSWHSECWRSIQRQEEGPPYIHKHTRKQHYIVYKLRKLME